MNAQRLDSVIFRCRKCGRIWAEEEAAEQCCKPGLCKHCGAETKSFYLRECNQCIKHMKGVRADTKVSLSDEGFSYNGPVYDSFSDNFYHSLEYLDQCVFDGDMEAPPYVWMCDIKTFNIDAENLVYNAFEEYACQLEDPDDVEMVDFEEMVKFVDEWNKKQKAEIWKPGETVIVLSEAWLAKWEAEL